jgi:16S rRNA (guanine966-N2)-methyltransferase
MVKSNIQIIAGKHRGKKLYMADKETTRSSKNILKESVFNTLQFEVVDSIFVEVFSGTGSVGLEALSRGAKYAYFLEKDRNSFRVLNENIKACKEEENSETSLGDSFETIWDVVEKLQRNKEKAFFYFDPPFAIREGNEDIYDKVVDTMDQQVLKRECKGMAHMQAAGHIRRRHHDHIRFGFRRRVTGEIAAAFPAFVPVCFDDLRIVGLGEFCI